MRLSAFMIFHSDSGKSGFAADPTRKTDVWYRTSLGGCSESSEWVGGGVRDGTCKYI